MKCLIYPIATVSVLLLSGMAAAEHPLYRMRLDGPIGPTTAEFFDKTIEQAEAENAVCLVVEMDTPGGLDAAMRRIVKRILSADLPVVVYVSPSGSRAASAGAFIATAAHVAAMAPGTNIGAAHPVQLGGGMPDTTMSAKVENDAAAYIRSLAEKRGRNPDWAEKAVRESASITAREALEQQVIDIVTPSFPALLDSLDGRRAEVLTGNRQIQTKDIRLVEIEMGLRERLLSKISDPNIAYILMLLGMYGLLFEIYNPGSLFPGILGGICIILAFYALQTLPVNYAGLLLILLGIVFFVLEVKVPSYGLLTIGGIVSMALGSTMLFDTPDQFLRVSWTVIAPAVGATALFFGFAVGMGIRAQRLNPKGGLDDLVGQIGVARTEIGTEGTAFVVGEYWQASCEGRIESGKPVQVVEIAGNRLKVKST